MTDCYEDEDDVPRHLRGHHQVHDIPDDLWVPALVQKRLIEATRVILRTAGQVGPGSYSGGIPRVMLEAMGDGESALPDPRKLLRLNLSARQMTLVEQASYWPMTYLKDHDGARRVLMLFLRCKAYRDPFNAAVKRKRWARMTAYRRRDEALRRIAEGLNQDRVKVEV